jgi:hypothetical protein
MRFTNAVCVVILAATASATAIPNAAAEPWCGYVGQPCGKSKRDAAPAPAPVSLPEPAPWCGYVGQPCGKREAAPEPIAAPEAGPWCGYVGQPCGKVKRDATPEADAWCGYVGQPCGKVKRAAEALAEALAEPNAAPDNDALQARCNAAGGACYNAKRLTRDLAAIVATTLDDPEAYWDNLDIEEEDSKLELSLPIILRNHMLTCCPQHPRKFAVTRKRGADMWANPVARSSVMQSQLLSHGVDTEDNPVERPNVKPIRKPTHGADT